jgi:hypothetical protein
MGRRMKVVVVAALVAGVLGGTVTRVPAEEQDHQYATDFGMGLGALGVNLFYMPAKLVYSLLGGITGSFAYGLTGGNLNIGRAIWKPTLGGTYVVTPRMLRGQEPILFSGPTEAPAAVHSSARVEAVPPATQTQTGSYQGY